MPISFTSSSLGCRTVTLGPHGHPASIPPPARPFQLTRPSPYADAVREVTPEVFLIARPALDWEGVAAYLKAVGGSAWLDRVRAEGESDRPEGERLVEFM